MITTLRFCACFVVLGASLAAYAREMPKLESDKQRVQFLRQLHSLHQSC